MNLLFLNCKTLFDTWPIATDFSRFAYGFPSVTFPQLMATISDVRYSYFDGIVEPIKMEHYKDLLRGQDAIMISVQSAKIALNTEMTIKLIKRMNPECIIVLGGQHPTFYAREWLERGADIVVRGEGEKTFPELISALNNGSSLSKIDGISYHEGDEIKETGEREFIKDLDDTPEPEWSSVDLWRYSLRMRADGFTAAVETARGCKMRCSFCSTSAAWKSSQRYKSVDRVIREIATLHKLRARQMIVVDDNFGGNYERDIEIVKEMQRRKFDINFFSFIRADTALNHPDFIEEAGKAGFRQAVVGYESLAPERLSMVQKGYRKNFSLEDYREVYRIFKKSNIFVLGQFIVGFPEEHPEEVVSTIENCNSICDCSTINPFKPIYGTKLASDLIESEADLDAEAIFYDLRYLPLYTREPIDKTAEYNGNNFRSSLYVKRLFSSDYLTRNYYRNIYKSSFKQLFSTSPEKIRNYLVSRSSKLTPTQKTIASHRVNF